MRKLVILILILFSLVGYSQRSGTFDTIKVYGGGSFEGVLVMDTNQIKQLDTATDNNDAVPFWQVTSLVSGSSYWTRLGNYLYPETITDSVGINTITPQSTFDVNGNAILRGRLSVENTGYSVFIGEDAGLNDDLTNNSNTFIGKDAGKLSTTGTYNVAIGEGALSISEIGNYNTVMGYYALSSCIGGIKNVAIGFSALSNSTGDYNTSLGHSSLGWLVGGNYNVAIGEDAGSERLGGHFTSGTNNTFLGYNTRASADSATNQIGIGSNVTCKADSTAVIGGNGFKDVWFGQNGEASIHLNALYDTDNDLGTSGQILSSTATGTNWIDVATPDSINFKVDATNISQVEFIIGDDTIKESFGHVHTEYALQTQLDDLTSDTSLFSQTVDSIYMKTATDFGMQNKNIYNSDSIHANWFGGSDFELGESGSKIVIDADSILLTNPIAIKNGSSALIDGNTIYDSLALKFDHDGLITFSGDVSASWDANTGGTATINTKAVEWSMLNDNCISGMSAITHLELTDEVLISDGGVLKKADMSVFRDATGLRRATETLNSTQVNALGTAIEVIAAPGSGKYILVHEATVKINVTTLLEVGTQDLLLVWGTDFISKLNNVAVEWASTRRYLFSDDGEIGSAYGIVIPDNAAVNLVLSAATNPASGSATMDITIRYTIEDY